MNLNKATKYQPVATEDPFDIAGRQGESEDTAKAMKIHNEPVATIEDPAEVDEDTLRSRWLEEGWYKRNRVRGVLKPVDNGCLMLRRTEYYPDIDTEGVEYLPSWRTWGKFYVKQSPSWSVGEIILGVSNFRELVTYEDEDGGLHEIYVNLHDPALEFENWIHRILFWIGFFVYAYILLWPLYIEWVKQNLKYQADLIDQQNDLLIRRLNAYLNEPSSEL